MVGDFVDVSLEDVFDDVWSVVEGVFEEVGVWVVVPGWGVAVCGAVGVCGAGGWCAGVVEEVSDGGPGGGYVVVVEGVEDVVDVVSEVVGVHGDEVVEVGWFVSPEEFEVEAEGEDGGVWGRCVYPPGLWGR